MAEVYGFASAPGSIVILCRDISRLIMRLRRINDPKFKLLQTRLLLQERRLAGWVFAMKINSPADVKDRVHPDDVQTVISLLSDIQEYFSQANQRFESLAPSQKAPTNIRGLMAGLNWIYGGFEDLQLLVETIEALVSALYTIEPPPRYVPGQDSSNSQLHHNLQRAMDPDSVRRYTASQSTGSEPRPRDLLQEATYPGALSMDTFSQRSSAAGANLGYSTPELLTQETEKHIKNPNSIRNLFQMSVHTLEIISSFLPNKRLLVKVEWRLRLWASNILQEGFNLDQVLWEEDGGVKVYAPLRDCILRAFVDIVFTQQCWLQYLSTKTATSTTSSKLVTTQLEVLAFLGSEDIVEISIEQPVSTFDDAEDQQSFNEDIALRQLMQAADFLFQLSPAIRGVRRQAMLEHERTTKTSDNLGVNEGRVPATLENRSSGSSKWRPSQPEVSVTENNWLQMAQSALAGYQKSLAATESEYSRQGHPIDHAYSKVFQKEVERLDEFAKPVRSEKAAELVKRLLNELAKTDSPYTRSVDTEKKAKLTEKDHFNDVSIPGPSALETANTKEIAENVTSIIDQIMKIK